MRIRSRAYLTCDTRGVMGCRGRGRCGYLVAHIDQGDGLRRGTRRPVERSRESLCLHLPGGGALGESKPARFERDV